jgi:hypothetical protein
MISSEIIDRLLQGKHNSYLCLEPIRLVALKPLLENRLSIP